MEILRGRESPLQGGGQMDGRLQIQPEFSLKNKRYLKEMIDIFSKATGLNVAAVDLEGEIYLSSEDYAQVGYCNYIKNSTEGGCARCKATYQKACQEAARWNEPYFFQCHAGVVMWAVPVVMGESLIGAMVCGQVLLWEPDEIYMEELRQYHPQFTDEDLRILQREAGKLKVISVNQCQSAANLLAVIVRYMANTYDADFMEQKSLMDWRNSIRTQLEQRKQQHQEETFDMSVYLRRERRFLQYLRMADKQRADKLIPVLFTDIEILSEHNVDAIRRMLDDLMVMSSRALVEAGIAIDAVMDLVAEHRAKVAKYSHSDEMFRYTYQTFDRMLESAYLMIRSMEHASIIKSIRSFIDEHYGEKITMEDIAASVSMSPSYLGVLFKEKMNMTVHDYLIRVRIEKSIELMSRRDLSIKQVMQMCGIESQSYYNRIFKKMIGIPPGKYRNQRL